MQHLGQAASTLAAVGHLAPAVDVPVDPSPPIGRLSREVMRGLAGMVFARLAVNGGIRVVYPFLPVIARGLGVSLSALGLMVASRSVAGLAGPLLARVAGATRRRTLMVGSQVLVVAGSLLIVAPAATSARVRLALVGVGFVATGLARPLFDLPMQTWVSTRVPASGRGRAIGLTELGWALSLAVTVPAAGVLIDRFGWRSPFVLVAGMAACSVLVLSCTVPRDGPVATAATAAIEPVGPPTRSPGRRIPTGTAVCAAVGLAVAASESLIIVHGAWLATDLGLSVTQIGASTLLIAGAELTAAGFVVSVADRVGLSRTVFVALLASATVYAMLGLVGGRAALALAAIAAVLVAFEVTVVALLAFTSTVAQAPGGQMHLLGAFMAAVACGNVTGAVVAPVIFAYGGIALSGAVSAAAATAAAAVLWTASVPRSRVGQLVEGLRRPGDGSVPSPSCHSPRVPTVTPCGPAAVVVSPASPAQRIGEEPSASYVAGVSPAQSTSRPAAARERMISLSSRAGGGSVPVQPSRAPR